MPQPKRAADDGFEAMLLRAQSGGEDVPETIYDDLRLSFNTAIEGSQHALSQRDETIKHHEGEIQRLKALAFERMMNNDNMDVDEEPEKPSEPMGINSLFNFTNRKRR